MLKKHPVYLLTYDHGGYILWGPHFEERIESAVSWLEKYPRFKIGLDNESFAYDKYAGINPKIIDDIREMLVKFEGRFGIGSCTYGQPLSVFINEESNVRQLVYAIRTNLKHFGVTPPIYAISEHALHSQIPQLIKQAGYKGAIMRTHFMMYGYNPTYNEPYGWWVGDDGTRMPTIPSYEGQGSDFAITTYDNWVLTRWPDQTDQSLEQFAEKFKGMEPLLGSRYDDIVLRCEKLVEHVEKSKDYEWVVLEDLPSIYGEPAAEFHPGGNDFIVRMPWGYCGNKIFNACREAEISVGLAERANAAAVLAGGSSQQPELEESWKNLLIAQHHDIQICGLLKDADEYIPKSLEYSKKVQKDSMRFISSLFKTDHQNSLIVFNPLSWKTKQTVSTEIALNRGQGVDGFKVIYRGESLPCRVKALDKRQAKVARAIVSFEAELDALTANCYSIVPADGNGSDDGAAAYDAHSGILKTKYYEIKLNEKGICYIKNSETGVEYVNNGSGQLFRGIINGKDCSSDGKWVVHGDHTEVTAIQLGDIGGIPYEFRMVISNMTRRMDCHVSFTHHGEKIGLARKFDEFRENTNGFVHEEKLRFILNPCVNSEAVGIRDLPFLVLPTDDRYVQGNYWTAISDQHVGIAYFNKGAMCSVREKDGFSLPLEYANEYVWGSRFLYGKYEHDFSIYTFAGEWEKNDLHKRAIEYQYPFMTQELDDVQEGKLSERICFVEISADENMILSALYPEEDAVIARFYEYKGKDGNITIDSQFAEIKDEVSIMGQPISAVHGKRLDLRKHEIKSISLSPHSVG